MDENAKKKTHIDWLQGFFLISVALFFDLLSFVPIVNFVSSLFAWLTFSLWFYLRGASFMHPGRLATAATSAVLEFIPFVSWLPTITAGVIGLIVMVKLEDRMPALKKLNEKISSKPGV